MMTRSAAARRTRPRLLRDPPGERFTRRHARLRASRSAASPIRLLRLAAGVLLCVIGVVLMPLPGPGALIAIGGAALMAGESRRVARGLDRSELWLRARLPDWLRRRV